MLAVGHTDVKSFLDQADSRAVARPSSEISERRLTKLPMSPTPNWWLTDENKTYIHVKIILFGKLVKSPITAAAVGAIEPSRIIYSHHATVDKNR